MNRQVKKGCMYVVTSLLWIFLFMLPVSAEKGVMKGYEFTTFNAMTLDGQRFQLGHQGYPMVVNFWATWCPPCRGEMPEFQKFSQRNPDVELYLVSLREDAGTIRNYLRENQLNLNPVIDPTGKGAEYYRVTAIPTTVVVNAEGMIIFRKVGPITASELEQVLGR